MTARCTQPGCPGTIEDGYCDVCGAPDASADRVAAPSTQAGASGSAASRADVSSRLGTTPLGSVRTGSSRPTRRIESTRTRTQHLGAGITSVPAAPVPDPRSVVMQHPEVEEGKRFCSNCNAPVGRSHDGLPGRTSGFCPKCRDAVQLRAEAAAGVARERPVRGRRRARARWSRMGVPRARPQCVRSLRGVEGFAEHRRPGRLRRGGCRAAVPGRGTASPRGRDLQLHAARGCGLHRHGVRGRPQPQADLEGPHGRQQRPLRRLPRRSGDRVHRRDPAGVLVSARSGSALLRLQARQRGAGRRQPEADRPRRGARAPTTSAPRSTGRSASRRRRSPRSGRASPPTCSRSAARSRFSQWSCAATRQRSRRRCRPSRTHRSSSNTTRCTASCRRPPRKIPTTASRVSTSCATSCSGSCARRSRGRRAPRPRTRRRRACSGARRRPTRRWCGRSCRP